MNKLLGFSAIALSVLLALPAAAAQRTFVASFGSDLNACTLLSPCRSFGVALAITDADGEVIALDSAGYGTVTITQSVSIIAPEGVYAGISVFGAQNGIVVNAGARVVLRGLTVNGQGGNEGIWVIGGGEIHIERCVVANMGDVGILIAGGSAVHISGSAVRSSAGDGIRVGAGSPRVFVSNTRVTQSGGAGIHAQFGRLELDNVESNDNASYGLQVQAATSQTVRGTVRNSQFRGNNSTSVFVAATNTGSAAHLTVDNSISSGNAAGGFFVNGFQGPATLILSRSVVSENGSSGVGSGAGAGAVAIVRDSTIVRNNRGLDQTAPATLISCGDNLVTRNTLANAGTVTPGSCNN